MLFSDFATIDLANCAAVKNKKKSKYLNRQEFCMWLAYFAEMGINRYKITGDYPETIDERTILQSLFWYGSFTIFNDGGVTLALPGLGASDLTIYGYPRKVNVFGRNGYNKQISLYQMAGNEQIVNKGTSGLNFPDKSGFWLLEKKFSYPLANYAILTAERVADAMRAMDVIRTTMKTPFVAFTIEEMVRTVKQYFENIKDNDDLIISTGVFDPSKVQIQPLDVKPENLKAMRELVEWYSAQYLNLCGIYSNPASDKKERLLVDEVNANDEETQNNVNSEVDFLNEQLKVVNKIMGFNMRMEANYGTDKNIRGDFGTLSDNDVSGERDAE